MSSRFMVSESPTYKHYAEREKEPSGLLHPWILFCREKQDVRGLWRRDIGVELHIRQIPDFIKWLEEQKETT